MSFFNKHFYVGMLAGAIALVGVGVVATVALLIVIPKTISVGGGSGPGSIPIASMLPELQFPTGDEPIVEWQLTDLAGNETDLAALSEKVVFVNRWATWCTPCVAEMPTIESLADEFADRDMAFVIVSTEPVDTVAPFVEDRGWNLPIYTAKRVPPVFQTRAIPATFVLDETRRVIYAHVGSALWDAQSAIEYFNSLFGSSA